MIRNFVKRRWGLTVSLVLFIFAIMMAAILLAGAILVVLHLAGVLDLWGGLGPGRGGGGGSAGSGGGPLDGIFVMFAFSMFLGTSIALFFSRKALNPLRKIIEATHKVADGDFSVRLDIKSIYELEELSGSFNKMVHELSSIETLRSDFINSFSHEFKTPIVSIRGFAKLLKDEDLSQEDRQEYLGIIIAETERLSDLSTNIMSLTKYENLEIIADVTSYRLDEQLRRAVIQFEPKWAGKGINVNVETEEIVFSGNADLTQQVFLNLIDNAIKFTGDNGAISLLLSKRDDGVSFTVRDDGAGMDDHTLGHIFDKFFQGDASRAKEGNGIGLAIVKRIVDLCGGSIEVESEPGWGSEFVIWLPF